MNVILTRHSRHYRQKVDKTILLIRHTGKLLCDCDNVRILRNTFTMNEKSHQSELVAFAVQSTNQ
ncbi:hypothetical protein TH19_12440 [Thalassospira profundimaris]|uniref:Uncharacterized protein n=1 Tax=Thalassospira profundimaris TaxID=502049 RepID=A0A367W5P6_9PROT|nr:hypothetical protein TH19_12440 [Thalassospira profundimaris]